MDRQSNPHCRSDSQGKRGMGRTEQYQYTNWLDREAVEVVLDSGASRIVRRALVNIRPPRSRGGQGWAATDRGEMKSPAPLARGRPTMKRARFHENAGAVEKCDTARGYRSQARLRPELAGQYRRAGHLPLKQYLPQPQRYRWMCHVEPGGSFVHVGRRCSASRTDWRS